MDKIVYFDEYCDTCKHKTESETSEKCSLCLDNPVNENSHKPVYYESDKK